MNWTTIIAGGAFMTFLYKILVTGGAMTFLFSKPLIAVGAGIVFILLWKRR